MANPLRTAFIGIPSLLAREALRAVAGSSTLVGIAESKSSYWRPSGEFKNYQSGFTLVAKRRRIPFLLLGSPALSNESLRDWLKKLQPDLLCVASMKRLLTPEEFSIPRLGAINLHPSLLPKCRGPDPYYWQYRNFDLNGGVTIHQISAGMDEGEILVQTPFSISLGDRLDTTIAQSATLGAAAFGAAIQQLAAGIAVHQPQRESAHSELARFVPKGEIPAGWRDWPIDRAWHFLRGTHREHPFLDVPFARPHQWDIGEREAGQSSGSGVIEQDDRGYVVAHPQGVIRMLPPQPWTLRRKLRKRFDQIASGWQWRI